MTYDVGDSGKVESIVRKELLDSTDTEYHTAKVNVVRDLDDKPEHLVVYLLNKATYTAEVVKIGIDDQFQVKGLTRDYDDSDETTSYEQDNERRPATDYANYDFVVATPVPEIPTALAAVNALADLAQANGLRVKKLLGAAANVGAYQSYLRSRVRGFVNIGHGSPRGIILDDGILSANWFASLARNQISPAVVYFNSCQVFNAPLQPAIMAAGARTFIGGIVNLYIGPSEEVCKCFWSKSLTTSTGMGKALKNCEAAKYPTPGSHGISGDEGPFARSGVKLVVPNFGYDAGGWRVNMHPRFVADVTGDRKADIIGFGNAGVYISLNQGAGKFTNPKRVIDNFGYSAGGWRVDKHPRFVADLTGDHKADVVGFGNAGVYVSLNKGSGKFANPTRVINNFGYTAGGWRVDKHPRLLADLTGDGKADIVGFGNAGVYVSLNQGAGKFTNPKRVIDNFGYNAGGWRVGMHPRFAADMSGDGKADIVGFGNAGVYISFNRGGGNFAPPKLVVQNFGYKAGGWRVGMHPRMLADVTGNGMADIIGFGNAGVYVAYNLGGGRFTPPRLVVRNFGYKAGGWRVDRHPRFVVDRNGDGKADIVGFGNAGVYVARNRGNGTFTGLRRVVDNFGYKAGGWRVGKHPRTLADLTGNGGANIVGFGNAGVYIAK